ncbi:2-nitropropane dioxygenase [Epithele typhae]|uniref:2-nitropropane dioxygenase n=1 Tax=Epithele typhae TaxID=378194 RepID=UPI0020087884|nr:2-nitropropane dioxygenase [Epithele typhae]KAH9946237.1 2-nitropropane dioxygenase [Epithele typhae]
MPSSAPKLSTPLTKLFGINHPVMLAAVTNAGGIGVMEGSDREIKAHLEDPNAPFGVDLLIPQVGGQARKTNLPELTDVIIQGGAKLFVCAVGVPPKEMVDKLHAAGIVVMKYHVGHPKHVPKALAQGVDVICAQGGEGGGHTGETPFSVLIPAVIDLCRTARSPLTGEPVIVVAAGGIADGRGLAAAFAYGAAGVWVGTRFVASEEAGAPKVHKDLVLSAGGRPMHVRKTAYVASWCVWCGGRKIPNEVELEQHPEKSMESRMWLMGKVAGSIKDIKPAKEIVDELVNTAVASIQGSSHFVLRKPSCDY